MAIPFLDLKAQYLSIKDELDKAVFSVLDQSAFAGGPFVQKFEEEFAAYCGTKFCAGVSSGTSAIWLALAGLGIGPGDEVITAVNTFIATAEAISMTGATPVFVDVDELSYNMNPVLLEAAITEKTKAIVPVHLYGQMADMEPIMAIAKKHGLLVVEDASQAHGAEYKGQKAGSIGHAGCFSFYPGKNLGAYGEAGAVVTSDLHLVEKIRMLRDHGQSQKYYHDFIGWNARMDGIQGAVLSVKLKYLDRWNQARRQIASLYRKHLADAEAIFLPGEAEHVSHVYHIFAIRLTHRDELLKYFRAKGIGCGIHYPFPLHKTAAYRNISQRPGTFPVAENCAAELLSLPIYPELSGPQTELVAREIKNFMATRKNHADL